MKEKIKEKLKSLRKYIILFPLIFILGSCAFYSAAYKEIIEEQLDVKNETIAQFIDTVALSVDYLSDNGNNWTTNDSYVNYILSVVDNIDSRYMVFATAYNENLEILRGHKESQFDPVSNVEFKEQVLHEENGFVQMKHDHIDRKDVIWRIYFRWVPTNKNTQDRVLIVTAVCEDSIKLSLDSWISAGILIQTVISVALQVWMVVEIQRKRVARKG